MIKLPVKISPITNANENPIYNREGSVATIQDADGQIFACLVPKDKAPQIVSALNAQAEPDEFVKEVQEQIEVSKNLRGWSEIKANQCLATKLEQALSIITALRGRVEKLESNQCQNCIGIEALEEK